MDKKADFRLVRILKEDQIMKGFIIGLVLGIAAAGTMTAYKAPEAVYAEYTAEDPDFAEANYAECNRLGDTDFFGLVKDDGSILILEEDMKWTLESGDLDAITKRLEGFEDRIIQLRANGQTKYSCDMWVNWATEAIEGK
jgi:hypothetical protein